MSEPIQERYQARECLSCEVNLVLETGEALFERGNYPGAYGHLRGMLLALANPSNRIRGLCAEHEQQREAQIQAELAAPGYGRSE